jgi:hypothetical protein
MQNRGYSALFFYKKSKRSNGVMSEDIQLYTCYSLNLRNYLNDNGVRYKLAARNPNSNKLFWVYVKNKQLNNLLTQWDKKE